MIIYVLFLGLLSQSFASNAAQALPQKKLTMAENASRYQKLTPLGQKFERFLGTVPYFDKSFKMFDAKELLQRVLQPSDGEPGEFDMLISGPLPVGKLFTLELAGNPALAHKFEVVAEAVCAGNLPKRESPNDYLDRLLVSHRTRAQSEPMPEVISLAFESVSLPRPVSLPAETFSHARASSPVRFVRFTDAVSKGYESPGCEQCAEPTRRAVAYGLAASGGAASTSCSGQLK